MENFKLSIQILSPLHIGTETDLSPFDYVIKNKKLHFFKLEKLINNLDQKDIEQYYKFIDQSNVLGLRNFILRNFDENKDSIYSIPVTDKVVSKYDNTINDLRNQLLISPFIHHPLTYRRFLPGSSIKGAIRTAVVDYYAHQKIKPIAPYDNRKSKYFEPRALSFLSRNENKININHDPFRCIKISDVEVPQNSTIIGEILNARRKKNKSEIETISIQMIKEVLSSLLQECDIQLDSELLIENNGKIKSYFQNNSLYFDHTTIIESCKSFYSIELEREIKFYQGSFVEQFLQKIKDVKLNQNEFLLRLGRYSGVYAVTVNDFRNPTGRRGKFGTSRNLFEGKYPLGWLKCKLVQKQNKG